MSSKNDPEAVVSESAERPGRRNAGLVLTDADFSRWTEVLAL
jgi:hypothetical protein